MSPSGIVKVEEGQSVTFSIIAATQGDIDEVLIDGSSVG
mgnify:FL=1